VVLLQVPGAAGLRLAQGGHDGSEGGGCHGLILLVRARCVTRPIQGISEGGYIVEKTPQPPLEEITERINIYAELRSFVFDEDKDIVLEGLLGKKAKFGDFYCPCRMEHNQMYVCPCQETRTGFVLKNGHCY